MGSESTCCRFIQDSSPKVLYPCWTVVPTDHEWNSSPSPPTCSHSPGTQQHVYSHLCSWLPHPLDTLPSPEKYRAAKNFCNANQTITVVHIPASPAVSAALFDHSYRPRTWKHLAQILTAINTPTLSSLKTKQNKTRQRQRQKNKTKQKNRTESSPLDFFLIQSQ